jgi:hypothetical protein
MAVGIDGSQWESKEVIINGVADFITATSASPAALPFRAQPVMITLGRNSRQLMSQEHMQPIGSRVYIA